MHNQLINQVEKFGNIKYIFFDYYDTVVHRKVHPLQVLKIWAMHMKREMGLGLSIDKLFEIRNASIRHLMDKSKLFDSEISYNKVMQEVYKRLVSTAALNPEISIDTFIENSSEADFRAESSVQYLNKKMISTIQSLKEQGYKIFCVSDWYCEEEVMERLIRHHGIEHLYDHIYVSCSHNSSKANHGTLFSLILEKHAISSDEVLMVGDNFKSDITNAKLHGLETFFLKNRTQKLTQKYQLLKSNKNDYKKVLNLLRNKGVKYFVYLIGTVKRRLWKD